MVCEPTYILYYTQKWGRAARRSKANKEARLVERKVCFVSDAGNQSGEGGLLSKGRLPPTDSQWTRAFIDGGRGLPAENSTVGSDSHLEIGHWWSDERHLDCFKYS